MALELVESRLRHGSGPTMYAFASTPVLTSTLSKVPLTVNTGALSSGVLTLEKKINP